MGLIDSIKKNATSNGTKIQSSEASKLEKVFNAMFYLPHDIDEEAKFVKQVMTRGSDTQERRGLHASAFIVGEKEWCTRQQVLSLLYKQLQKDNVNVGLLRIFEEGNAVHEKWQRLFIRAGYAKAKDLDFTQFNEEYMISYTPDVICSIPQFYDGKMVGEIKSVNTYAFKKQQKHPSAWKQLQWYMFLTGIHKGFVLCDDKNCQDFKIEVYEYDPKVVAAFIDRAEQVKYYYNRVVNEHKMVKRPSDATNSSCKRCEKCSMRDACWNVGMGRVKLD